MSKRTRLWPFCLIPYYWGIDSKTKEIERAKYYYEGEELDRRLLDLENEKDSLEWKKQKIKIDKKYDKISENEYDKEDYTLNKKPYFRVISGEYTPSENGDGQMMFELDWNEFFVDELRAAGWPGHTEDQIINSWFDDACRQMIQEDVEEEGHSFVSNGPRVRKQNLGDNKSAVG